MKTISSGFALVLGIAVASVLGAAGCSKKDDKGGGGAAAADPCDAAINTAIDAMLAKSNTNSQAPTPMIEIGNKLRTIMLGRCKADKWSESSLACFRAATDQPSIKACRQGLPAEQSQRLQQEIMKVMTSGGPGGMGGAPPHGGAGGPGGMGGGPPHGGAGGAGSGAAPAAGSADGSGAAPSGSGN